MERSKTSFAWIAIGSLAMLFLVVLVGTFVYNEKKVTIFVDGKARQVLTNQISVNRLLEEQGIGLGAGDVILTGGHGRLEDGMELAIIRGKPTLLMVDGEIREIIVPVPDAKQILLQEGIKLDPQDRIEAVFWPQGDVDETFIKVTRIKELIVIEEEELDFPVLRQPDYRLLEGRQQVIEAGEKGLIRRRIELVYEDKEETIREVVWEKVVAEPKRELVVYGTAKPMPIASRGGYSDLREEELRQVLTQAPSVYEMEATAYTHTGNPTFTGIMPYVGVVAVDPKVIPLGSRLYVEGYGFGLAADTGGLIKGNIVDVFMDTQEEALRWGRRQVRVYRLD